MAEKISKPLLYFDDLNPHSRAVLMLLKLLNVDVELRHVNLLKGEHLKPGFAHINPARNVPVMVHHTITITESHAILMYICDNFAGDYSRQLLPNNCYKKRLRIYNKLFFESSILHRRHGQFMTDLVRKTSAETDIPFHERRIKSAYDALEGFLHHGPYMTGNSLTIADLAMVATVGALDMMFPLSDDRTRWRNLYDWHKRMKAMPVHKINFNGIEKQREVVEMYGHFEFPSTLKRRSTAAIRHSKVPRLTLNASDSCSIDEEFEEELKRKNTTDSSSNTNRTNNTANNTGLDGQDSNANNTGLDGQDSNANNTGLDGQDSNANNTGLDGQDNIANNTGLDRPDSQLSPQEMKSRELGGQSRADSTDSNEQGFVTSSDLESDTTVLNESQQNNNHLREVTKLGNKAQTCMPCLVKHATQAIGAAMNVNQAPTVRTQTAKPKDPTQNVANPAYTARAQRANLFLKELIGRKLNGVTHTNAGRASKPNDAKHAQVAKSKIPVIATHKEEEAQMQNAAGHTQAAEVPSARHTQVIEALMLNFGCHPQPTAAQMANVAGQIQATEAQMLNIGAHPQTTEAQTSNIATRAQAGKGKISNDRNRAQASKCKCTSNVANHAQAVKNQKPNVANHARVAKTQMSNVANHERVPSMLMPKVFNPTKISKYQKRTVANANQVQETEAKSPSVTWAEDTSDMPNRKNPVRFSEDTIETQVSLLGNVTRFPNSSLESVTETSNWTDNSSDGGTEATNSFDDRTQTSCNASYESSVQSQTLSFQTNGPDEKPQTLNITIHAQVAKVPNYTNNERLSKSPARSPNARRANQELKALPMSHAGTMNNARPATSTTAKIIQAFERNITITSTKETNNNNGKQQKPDVRSKGKTTK